MICNFYPFNFVISYTNKLPILWFISWYHSNNDWKYYNTFLQSCTFNQDLKEQKWQQDYVWSLNEKTYFKKPNVNATIFPYPLYTSIVYGCSIPHRHSDATQMDKMCVQFLYARRTFQMVAVWNDRLKTGHLWMVSVRFLRDSLVVARVWSGFKARGLNVIIMTIRNEDQSRVVRDIKWQMNIPNLIAYHPWLEKELDDGKSTVYHSKNKN